MARLQAHSEDGEAQCRRESRQTCSRRDTHTSPSPALTNIPLPSFSPPSPPQPPLLPRPPSTSFPPPSRAVTLRHPPHTLPPSAPSVGRRLNYSVSVSLAGPLNAVSFEFQTRTGRVERGSQTGGSAHVRTFIHMHCNTDVHADEKGACASWRAC